jgi:hypothetical protein
MLRRLLPRPRTVVIGAVLLLPPSYAARAKLLALEAAYPPLPVSTCSPELVQPREAARQRCSYADIYGARVPLAGLPDAASLEDGAARAFMSTRALRIRDGTQSGYDGTRTLVVGEKLVGGALHVDRAPAPGAPLLVSWTMPPHLPTFFEALARWGYPWRLMDGGRHEVGLRDVDAGSGEATLVFGTAHDYAVVPGEKDAGKIIPGWVGRLHRAYAMFLLDEAAKDIRVAALERTEI